MSAHDMSKPSETNWDRIGAMTDEMIDASDIPPLTESFFSKATLRTPRQPVPVTMLLDPEVLAWFQSQGPQCERRINAALRIYVEAHRQ